MHTEIAQAKARVIDVFHASVRASGQYGPTEADSNLNNANRALINAFCSVHSDAHRGRINVYNPDRDGYRDRPLQPIDPEVTVCNFAFDVIVPAFDQTLADMLSARHNRKEYTGTSDDAILIDQIFDRIDAIGGFVLTWA